MKKIFILLVFALISISTFCQVVVSGVGTPGSPYVITWVIRNNDTTITLPISATHSNYVFSWQVHWYTDQNTSASTAKLIPLEGPNAKDSLQVYMAFDTTKCVLVPQAYLRRTIPFSGNFLPSSYISFQFKKGNVTKGKLWFYQVFRTIL